MKVKNTSKRVIKLMHGKEKVTLVPGTEDVYDVTDNADVQFYINARDLVEVVDRPGRKPAQTNSKAADQKSKDDKGSDKKEAGDKKDEGK